MPTWLFVLLVIAAVAGAVMVIIGAFRNFAPRVLLAIIAVMALVIILGVSLNFSGVVGRHGASVKVGVGTTPSQTVTTPMVTTPAAPPPASSSTTPWPGPQTSTTPAAPPYGATKSYAIDGHVHVFVDLADTVHDGQLAAFSYTAINGTDQVIHFSRAAVAIGLDGLDYVWQPVHDLQGPFHYLVGGGWYVSTGSLAPGQRIDFQGMVPIPDRSDSADKAASVACLQGDLQVVYPGKPNASLLGDNFSSSSCSAYAAS